ncbi:TDP-4-oxo-6-deoxy-alpha-D-glucose-3,4-oxoisomerase [compost metagenome]
MNGSCRFVMDNGAEKSDVVLNSPLQGLLIDTMQWHEMYDFSSDCILLVLASDIYDEADYIRSYDDFLQLAKRHD